MSTTDFKCFKLGSSRASHDSFDVILNFNYPENFVRQYTHDLSIRQGKMIFRFGLTRSRRTENLEYLRTVVAYLSTMIPSLSKRSVLLQGCTRNDPRILVIAVAYLVLCGECEGVHSAVARVCESISEFVEHCGDWLNVVAEELLRIRHDHE